MTEKHDLIDAVDQLRGLQDNLRSQQEPATVIFVDLSESIRYKEERGHLKGIAKNIQFNLIVSEAITSKATELENQGRIDDWDVVKYIGDEVMACLIGEQTSGAAVEIAANIQSTLRDENRTKQESVEEIHAKIAINTGDVLFARYQENAPEDPQGLSVDVAARLTSLAKPDQILAGGQVANDLDGGGSYRIGQRNPRDLSGIEKKTDVVEIDWGDGFKNVATKEAQSISTIDANPQAVERYIEEHDLLQDRASIDLSLYTFETLAASMRSQLTRTDSQLSFRILVRNPQADQAKADHVRGSMRTIREMIQKNDQLLFSVRFYDSPPILRTYAFQTDEESEPVGLCGIYKYDESAPSNFVGAENNQLIVCEGSSIMEETLLEAHTSRFRYNWKQLSEDRALIFDLDGLLIDTMGAYEEAWLSAFRQFGLTNVPARTFYEREGEQSRNTVTEVFEKYRGHEPSDEIVTAMINRRDEVLEEAYEPEFFPHARELIERLSRKDLELCLVTGSTDLESKFDGDTTFLNTFDQVVTGANKSAHDSPQNPYRQALDLLNMKPEQCRVIENAPLGVQAATSADIPTFVVNDNSPLPDDIFEDTDALEVFGSLQEIASILLLMDTNTDPETLLDIID